jgi:hypothetical protein
MTGNQAWRANKLTRAEDGARGDGRAPLIANAEIVHAVRAVHGTNPEVQSCTPRSANGARNRAGSIRGRQPSKPGASSATRRSGRKPPPQRSKPCAADRWRGIKHVAMRRRGAQTRSGKLHSLEAGDRSPYRPCNSTLGVAMQPSGRRADHEMRSATWPGGRFTMLWPHGSLRHGLRFTGPLSAAFGAGAC